MKKTFYLSVVILFFMPLNFTTAEFENGEISLSNPLSLEEFKRSGINILIEEDHIINGRREKKENVEDIFLNNEAFKFSLITIEDNRKLALVVRKYNFSGHGAYQNGKINYSQKYEKVNLIYNQKITGPLNIGAGIGMSSTLPWDYSAGVRHDTYLYNFPVSLILNSSKSVYPGYLDLSYKDEFRAFLIRESVFKKDLGLKIKLSSWNSLELNQSFVKIDPSDRIDKSSEKPCQYNLSNEGKITSIGTGFILNEKLIFNLRHSLRNDNLEMRLKENQRVFGYISGGIRGINYEGELKYSQKKEVLSFCYSFNKWTGSGSGRLESWPFRDGLEELLSEDRAYDYNGEIINRSYGIKLEKLFNKFGYDLGLDYDVFNLNGRINEFRSLFFGMIQNLIEEHILNVKKIEVFTPNIRLKYSLKNWEISYGFKQYIPFRIVKESKKEEGLETTAETGNFQEKYKGGDFHQISLSYYF